MTNITKITILDAAERLFADAGFSATSLRTITSVAGVNLAAVNYHFGSKDGLLDAVLERRIGPLNEARMVALNTLRDSYDGTPFPVVSVVRAFVDPLVFLSAEGGYSDFLKVLGRAMFEPGATPSPLVRSYFDSVLGCFRDVLALALPDVSEAELDERIKLMTAAITVVMIRLHESLRMPYPPETLEKTIDTMVNFITFGISGGGDVN